MPRTRSGVRGRVVKGLIRIGSLLWVIAVQAAETDPLARYETTHTLPDLHHAVGMSLPDDWPAPEDLPLGSRRVVECKTCHGLKDLERIPYRQVDKQAVNFLRGGPYARLDDFCIRCHDRKALERPNIHILLDEQGKIREDRCTYCHEEVQQNRDEPHRAVDYRLRLPPEKLCYGCHGKLPHFNALEHQAAKPDETMRRHIRASEQQQGVKLPLSGDGRVMCPTCHAPHQHGVIDAAENPAGRTLHPVDLKRGVEYRDHPWNAVIQRDKAERLKRLNQQQNSHLQLDYRRIEQEVLLRLEARNGRLCLACHQFRD